jgi:tetratricopeptide (TPR) repeat protein
MKKLKEHQWVGPDKEAAAASRKLAERVIAGESLQQVLEIPEATAEQFYDYAQELLTAGRYEDSAAVLFVISMICPERPGVWLSYGICQHHLKNFATAKKVYEHTSTLDPELIQPYVFAAQCAIGLNDKEAAINFLNQMDAHGKPTKEEKEIVALAKRLKKELSHG